MHASLLLLVLFVARIVADCPNYVKNATAYDWRNFSMTPDINGCWYNIDGKGTSVFKWLSPPIPVVTGALQLTRAVGQEASAVFFVKSVYVLGFESTFVLNISNLYNGAESAGVAFVIMNDPGSHANLNGMGLNYGDTPDNSGVGFKRSLAIEFDMYKDEALNDPDGYHVGAHGNRPYPATNNAAEQYVVRGGDPADVGVSSLSYKLQGTQNEWTVRYVPSTVDATAQGLLELWVGGVDSGVRLLHTHIRLTDYVDQLEAGARAYIGFTATTGATKGEQTLVKQWTYAFYGRPNAKQSRATGDGTAHATAGAPTTFDVQLHDQFFAPYTSYLDGAALDHNVTLVASIDTAFDPSATIVPPVPTGQGRFTVSYTARRAGVQNVTLLLAPAPQSGALVGGASLAPVIHADGTDAARAHWLAGAAPANASVAGVRQTARFAAFDRYDNPAEKNVSVALTLEPAAAVDIDVAWSAADGSYALGYTIYRAGTYSLRVTLGGADAPQLRVDGVRVQPAAPYGPHCTAIGNGLSGMAAGVAAHVAIQLVDAFNNTINDATRFLSALSITASYKPASKKRRAALIAVNGDDDNDDDNGHSLRGRRRRRTLATLNNADKCQELPPPCVPERNASRDARYAGDALWVGGGQFEFTYRCYKFGDKQLYLQLTGADGLINGTQLIAASPYRIHTDSTGSVTVGCAVWPAQCDSADCAPNKPPCTPCKPMPAAASGFEIDVNTLDGSQNRLKRCVDNVNISVTFNDSALLPPPVQSCVKGKFTVLFGMRQAGAWRVRVDMLVPAVPLYNYSVGTKLYQVVPAATFADQCTVAGPPSYFTKHNASFTIEARDRYGNHRRQGGDAFLCTLTPAKGGSKDGMAVSAKASDYGNGTYGGWLRVEKSGQYTLSITLNGKDVLGSPMTVSVEWSGASNTVILVVGLVLLVILVALGGGFFAYRRYKSKKFYRL